MTPPLPPLVGVPVVGKTLHPGVALLLLQESLELDSLVLELMSSLMSWYCPEAAPALQHPAQERNTQISDTGT